MNNNQRATKPKTNSKIQNQEDILETLPCTAIVKLCLFIVQLYSSSITSSLNILYRKVYTSELKLHIYEQTTESSVKTTTRNERKKTTMFIQRNK